MKRAEARAPWSGTSTAEKKATDGGGLIKADQIRSGLGALDAFLALASVFLRFR